jgi:hypothetical protein
MKKLKTLNLQPSSTWTDFGLIRLPDFEPDEMMEEISRKTIVMGARLTPSGVEPAKQVSAELWIAGGAPASILMGEKPRDYDVYIHVENPQLYSYLTVYVPGYCKALVSIPGGGASGNRPTSGYLIEYVVGMTDLEAEHKGSPLVQVMVTSRDVAPFLTFDWVTRWFMWNHRDGLVTVPEAIDDLAEGVMHLAYLHPHRVTSSLLRVADQSHRYRFRVPESEILKITNMIQANTLRWTKKEAEKLNRMDPKVYWWLKHHLNVPLMRWTKYGDQVQLSYKTQERGEQTADTYPYFMEPMAHWLEQHRHPFLPDFMQDLAATGRVKHPVARDLYKLKPPTCIDMFAFKWNCLLHTPPDNLDRTYVLIEDVERPESLLVFELSGEGTPMRVVDKLSAELGVRVSRSGFSVPLPYMPLARYYQRASSAHPLNCKSGAIMVVGKEALCQVEMTS